MCLMRFVHINCSFLEWRAFAAADSIVGLVDVVVVVVVAVIVVVLVVVVFLAGSHLACGCLRVY